MLPCARPLNCTTTFGALTIASTSLHGPAWCLTDTSPLLESPEFRGANILVERLNGRVARPHVTDETDYSLRVMFSGYSNQAGTPWANQQGGLLQNRAAFETTFINPIRAASATLAASLVVPNGSGGTTTYNFNCQPLRLRGWAVRRPAYGRGILELRLPVPDLMGT